MECDYIRKPYSTKTSTAFNGAGKALSNGSNSCQLAKATSGLDEINSNRTSYFQNKPQHPKPNSISYLLRFFPLEGGKNMLKHVKTSQQTKLRLRSRRFRSAAGRRLPVQRILGAQGHRLLGLLEALALERSKLRWFLRWFLWWFLRWFFSSPMAFFFWKNKSRSDWCLGLSLEGSFKCWWNQPF